MPITFVCFLLWFNGFSLVHPYPTRSFVPGYLYDSHIFPKNIHKLPSPPSQPLQDSLVNKTRNSQDWLSLPLHFYILCGWEPSASRGWGERVLYMLTCAFLLGLRKLLRPWESKSEKSQALHFDALHLLGSDFFCWAHSAISWPPANNALDSRRDLESNACVLSWAAMKAIATCRGYPDSKSYISNPPHLRLTFGSWHHRSRRKPQRLGFFILTPPVSALLQLMAVFPHISENDVFPKYHLKIIILAPAHAGNFEAQRGHFGVNSKYQQTK